MTAANNDRSGAPSLVFKLREMAGEGDTSRPGLYEYHKQVSDNQKVFHTYEVSEDKNSKCTVIILSLLALLAAGLGGTLIAISGGPNNLVQFGTGSGFGVVSVGLSAWLIAEIVISMKSLYDQKGKLADVLDLKITPKDALAAMENEQGAPDAADKAQDAANRIYHALLAIEPTTKQPARRLKFMESIYKQYFADGANPLSEGQVRVIAAFAKFPAELTHLVNNTPHLSREFALLILTYIDPQLIEQKKGNDEVGKRLLSILFSAADKPATAEECQIFARHPLAIAMLAQTKLIDDPVCVKSIYAEMSPKDKTLFLSKMGEDRLALAPGREGALKRNIIDRAIEHCLVHTLSHELDLFKVDVQDPAEKQNQQLLLQEIAKWPHITAPYLLRGDLSAKSNFIRLLDKEMQPTQRKIFIEVGASHLASDPIESRRYMKGCFTAYTGGDKPIPKLVRFVFGSVPHLMADLAPALDRDLCVSVSRAMTPEALEVYTDIQKLINLGTQDPAALLREMTSRLNALKSGDNRHLNKTLLFFTLYPAAFKKLVLFNEGLGKEPVRFKLALDLLEKMEHHAAPIIADMDSKSLGFPYFNYLTNLLVDEARELADPTRIVPSRGRLMARFGRSPKIKDRRPVAAIIDTDKWNLKPEGAAEWGNFNQIRTRFAKVI